MTGLRNAADMICQAERAQKAHDERGFAIKRSVREYVAAHPGCTAADLRRDLQIGNTDFWTLIEHEGVRNVEVRIAAKRGDLTTYWPTVR
jgi:hypothetical protein